MTETTPLFKILVDGKSAHGGNLTWSLPTQSDNGVFVPGRWHSVKGELEMCSNGLHVCTWDQAWNEWMKIDADIYEVETRGKVIRDHNKSVARSVRLMKPVELPDWWVKTREEIMTFKDVKWLQPDGAPLPEWKLFTADTWAAARDAAWDAAGDAAGDAARAAAWAAAGAAAWAAARDAAGAAAWDAARAAAWDAAGDAVRDAAGDARLNTLINITCADLPIDQKHRDYAAKRWQAWVKGYAVLCDVDGQLYVYAKA